MCAYSRFCWLWNQRGTEEREGCWIEKEGKKPPRHTDTETWWTEEDLHERSCECLSQSVIFQLRNYVHSQLTVVVLIYRSLRADCLKSIPWSQVRRLLRYDAVLGQPSSWMTFSPMMRLVKLLLCCVFVVMYFCVLCNLTRHTVLTPLCLFTSCKIIWLFEMRIKSLTCFEVCIT